MILAATNAAIAAAQQPGKSHFLYNGLCILLAGLIAVVFTLVIRYAVIAWCEYTAGRDRHQDWLHAHKHPRRFEKHHPHNRFRSSGRADKEEGIM